MQLLRSTIVRTIASAFMGIVFLNMGFFLIEVSALKMHKDRQLIENVAKLLAGSSAEEEQDGFGGTDEDTSMNEIDLIIAYGSHGHEVAMWLTNNNRMLDNHGIPLFGHRQIFSPPPEV